jgi:hypothetical protein
MNGKLSLQTGTDMYMPCHNDAKKKVCDHCNFNCTSKECAGLYCDAKKNCQCQRTQCICLGRD